MNLTEAISPSLMHSPQYIIITYQCNWQFLGQTAACQKGTNDVSLIAFYDIS